MSHKGGRESTSAALGAPSGTILIGIDPGSGGGIAWAEGGRVEVHKMPPTPSDLHDLIECVSPAFTRKRAFCVLEKVHAMPNQGVKSMFNFGMGYGMIQMALIACQIPYELVTPGRWKREFGLIFPKKMKLTQTQIKNKDKEMAQRLFPGRKVTHAFADALLIMEYACRTRGGG